MLVEAVHNTLLSVRYIIAIQHPHRHSPCIILHFRIRVSHISQPQRMDIADTPCCNFLFDTFQHAIKRRKRHVLLLHSANTVHADVHAVIRVARCIHLQIYIRPPIRAKAIRCKTVRDTVCFRRRPIRHAKTVIPESRAKRPDHRDAIHHLFRTDGVIALAPVILPVDGCASMNRNALGRNHVALIRICFVNHVLKTRHCFRHGLSAAAYVRTIHIQFPRIAVIVRLCVVIRPFFPEPFACIHAKFLGAFVIRRHAHTKGSPTHIKRLAVHVISKPRHAVSLKCVFQHHVGDFRRKRPIVFHRDDRTFLHIRYENRDIHVQLAVRRVVGLCPPSPLHRLSMQLSNGNQIRIRARYRRHKQERAKRGKYLFHCTSSHVMISGQSSSFSFSSTGFINSPVCALTIIVRYISRAIGAASASSLYSFVFSFGL